MRCWRRWFRFRTSSPISGAALGGIDTVEVMRGVHLSQYFRGRTKDGLPPITSFLNAGCGFGGSCLPKDVSALIAHGRKAGEPDAAARIRDSDQSRSSRARPWSCCTSTGRRLEGVRVAVLGLSFKPETSDVRESPAFPIMRELLAKGAVLTAYDPVARHEAEKVFPDPVVTTATPSTPRSPTSTPSSSSRPGRSSMTSRRG